MPPFYSCSRREYPPLAGPCAEITLPLRHEHPPVKGVAEVLNIPRALMTMLDYSAMLRQAVIPTIAHPSLAGKSLVEMIKVGASQKRYDRWFYDLVETPRLHEASLVEFMVARMITGNYLRQKCFSALTCMYINVVVLVYKYNLS